MRAQITRENWAARTGFQAPAGAQQLKTHAAAIIPTAAASVPPIADNG